MNHDAMLRPDEVRTDYNQTVRDVEGDYVRFRWLSSPTKQRHYAQTRASLSWAAERMAPGRLLEVGCGPAVWTRLFLPAATSATLLDISDEMLAGARQALSDRSGIEYLRADFAEAQLPDASVDTLLSVRAFEYMPDKARVLDRFARVVKPGGRLILVTKNAGWRDHRRAQESVTDVEAAAIPRSIRFQAGVLPWQELLQMARVAGFQDLRAHPVVIGSYDGLAQTRLALALFDLIHARTYRRAMRPQLDSWTESVMLLAHR